MKNNISTKEQINLFESGTKTFVGKKELETKIESGKKLVVKLGADPTAADLHLGHAVVLGKLKQFQECGHQVVFIIGDFTTKIGDPTGKSKTRPPLSDKQIDENAKTYFEQVFKILDKEKTQIRKNSEWLSKINLAETIKVCAKTTLAQLIEREDFKNRIKNNSHISFHELMYPILQGYDSVELQADVELGGTDQTFNLLFGRDLQEKYSLQAQAVLTMPILEGLDGKQKMSKSLDNYVGLNDDCKDAFGKLMSMPDTNILKYAQLLLSLEAKSAIESLVKTDPMQAKKDLAFEIIKKFWSQKEAQDGLDHFKATFENKDYSLAQEAKIEGLDQNEKIWIVDLLKQLKIAQTTSQAKILIESGAVSLNDEKIKDFKAQIKIESDLILKSGKKNIFKITKKI